MTEPQKSMWAGFVIALVGYAIGYIHGQFQLREHIYAAVLRDGGMVDRTTGTVMLPPHGEFTVKGVID